MSVGHNANSADSLFNVVFFSWWKGEKEFYNCALGGKDK